MKNKFQFAMTLALVLALVAATIVLADNLNAGGDGVTPVTNNDMSLGQVCANSTTTKSVLLVVNRTGNGNNVFKNGSTVTISVLSVGSGLSASIGTPNTVTLPTNWSTLPNNTDSSSVTSTVTITVGAAGSFNQAVTYRAGGVNSSNNSINRDNTMNVTATVVNCDTTPPTLNLPANMTVEATGASGAIVTYTATADDANPAHPTVTCTPASGLTFGFGETTVNCSATDVANNTANGSFKVTVVDTTPPTVTPPSSITVEAADADGAVVTYSGESATDLVDGDVEVSCDPVSGSTFPIAETTVTCSATDSHSNTGTASFTVKVQDTTKPVLSLPDDIVAEAISAAGAAVDFTTSASDLVDGDVAVSCDANYGNTFPLGTTEVKCSATDSNGNKATGSFKVTVQDKTAPTLTLPADFSVEATGSTGAVATFSASASDLVDGDVAVSCVPASGDLFPLGENSVACSATDAAGNTANGSFKITVVDTTAPELTVPADQQLEATGPDGAAATFSASATDAVDASPVVKCDAVSGSTFPLGTTTVNCSAIDFTGNKSTGSFVIIVEDKTAPDVIVPSDITTEATGPSGAAVTFSASATDIVDGAVVTSCTPASDSTFALGTTNVVCSATDAAGNTGSANFNVTVEDTTPPSVTVSSDITAEATGPSGAAVTFSASATDIVDGAVAPSCVPASGSTFALGTTNVVCSATDAAGNTGSANFNVKVQDTTLPTITFVNRLPAANGFGWNNSSVTVNWSCSDIVGVVAPSVSKTVSNEWAGQSATGTCEDTSHNTASDTQSGINIDLTNPTLTWNGGPAGGASYYFGSIPSAPTCDAGDTLSGPNGCNVTGYATTVGSHTMTATAYDKAGNQKVETRTYTVMAWNLLGFYQPVDMNGVWNTVKNGSTIPFKFEIFAGPVGPTTELMNTSAVVGFDADPVACPTTGYVADDIEVLATGGTSLRYDTTGGQFIFNWQTPKKVGACYKITMTTQDGSKLSALFKLK